MVGKTKKIGKASRSKGTAYRRLMRKKVADVRYRDFPFLIPLAFQKKQHRRASIQGGMTRRYAHKDRWVELIRAQRRVTKR